mgnify:CR=1 FL=1
MSYYVFRDCYSIKIYAKAATQPYNWHQLGIIMTAQFIGIAKLQFMMEPIGIMLMESQPYGLNNEIKQKIIILKLVINKIYNFVKNSMT